MVTVNSPRLALALNQPRAVLSRYEVNPRREEIPLNRLAALPTHLEGETVTAPQAAATSVTVTAPQAAATIETVTVIRTAAMIGTETETRTGLRTEAEVGILVEELQVIIAMAPNITRLAALPQHAAQIVKALADDMVQVGIPGQTTY